MTRPVVIPVMKPARVIMSVVDMIARERVVGTDQCDE